MLANQGFFSKSSRLLNVPQISNIVGRTTVIFIIVLLRLPRVIPVDEFILNRLAQSANIANRLFH